MFAKRNQKKLTNTIDTQIKQGKGANNPILHAQRASAFQKKGFVPMNIKTELDSSPQCSGIELSTRKIAPKRISNTNPLCRDGDKNQTRNQRHLQMAFGEDDETMNSVVIVNPLEKAAHLISTPTKHKDFRSMITDS